jgi:hypothetical protein
MKRENLLLVSLRRVGSGLRSARNVHFHQLLIAADEASVSLACMLVLVDKHGMAVASPEATLHGTNKPL